MYGMGQLRLSQDDILFILSDLLEQGMEVFRGQGRNVQEDPILVFRVGVSLDNIWIEHRLKFG